MVDRGAARPAPPLPPSAPAVQFYIPATSSLQERRPRTLKHGDTFGLFDHYGDIVPGEGSPKGLYHEDTRFLSGLQLLINDRRPLLLSSTVQDNNALLTADLTNPDFFDAIGRLDAAARHHPHRAREVHLAAARLRAPGGAQLRRPRSRDPPDAAVPDRFRRPVRGARPPAPGARRDRRRRCSGRHALAFTYHGLAGDCRRTILQFAPAPDQARARPGGV